MDGVEIENSIFITWEIDRGSKVWLRIENYARYAIYDIQKGEFILKKVDTSFVHNCITYSF